MNSHQYEYHNSGNFVVECLFIIEVIRRSTCDYENFLNDRLSSIKLRYTARRDLMVYDNQLPFSVLEALFELVFPAADHNFLSLCISFFSDSVLFNGCSPAVILRLQQQRSSGCEIKDFIDLLRKCHEPNFPRQPPTDSTRVMLPMKVTYLKEAGVAIRPSSIDSVCSLRYSKGRLEIPKLKLNYMSRHLLTNLMEYEMRHDPQGTFIVDYVHFMKGLIGTTKDVDILVDNHIVAIPYFDSEAVVFLFRSLTEESPFFSHNFYYHGISEAVHDYSKIAQTRRKTLFGWLLRL